MAAMPGINRKPAFPGHKHVATGSREAGGWIVFTVLLCVAAVVGVVMLDDRPAIKTAG